MIVSAALVFTVRACIDAPGTTLFRLSRPHQGQSHHIAPAREAMSTSRGDRRRADKRGETERNLRRVFDAAEAGAAVLLFDEADALFGKRSEVNDSHDRYANIETSYLLQRMESYRGLAILTTNFRTALDQAFTRRLGFIVEFPMPYVALRGAIWRAMFPANAPTDGLDFEQLARLSLSGGNIRNVALAAAFLAAEADEPVNMNHVIAAARGEYAKLERPLPVELGRLG